MRHGGLEKEALKLGGEKVISRRGERNRGGISLLSYAAEESTSL